MTTFKFSTVAIAIAAALAIAGCSSQTAPAAASAPVHSPTTLHLAGVAPGQLVEVQTADVLAVAPAVLVGRGSENPADRRVQLVTVHFANGTVRAVLQPPVPAFEVGEPVEIIGLENGDYPAIEPLPALPHPDATAASSMGGKRGK